MKDQFFKMNQKKIECVGGRGPVINYFQSEMKNDIRGGFAGLLNFEKYFL